MTDPSTGGTGESRGPTRRAVLVGGATALSGAAGLAGPAGFTGVAAAQGTTTGVIDVPNQWSDRDLAGFIVTVGVRDDGDGDSTATESGEGDGTGGETGTGDESGSDGGAEDGGAEDGDSEDGDAETGDGTGPAEQTDTGDGSGIGEDDGGDGQDSEPDCDYNDWPPGEVSTYDATLIDRKDSDAPEADITLRVSSGVDVPSSVVYLVNNFEHCESQHAGVELELLDEAGEEGTANPDVALEEFERPEDQPDDDEETASDGPGFGVLGALAGAAGLAGWLAKRRRRE